MLVIKTCFIVSVSQFLSLFPYPESSDSQNCRLAEHSYVTTHSAGNIKSLFYSTIQCANKFTNRKYIYDYLLLLPILSPLLLPWIIIIIIIIIIINFQYIFCMRQLHMEHHTIRKVLQCEHWSLCGRDCHWFKRSTRDKEQQNNNNNRNLRIKLPVLTHSFRINWRVQEIRKNW